MNTKTETKIEQSQEDFILGLKIAFCEIPKSFRQEAEMIKEIEKFTKSRRKICEKWIGKF